jgi:GNAT superfamily N-acetyltransferase
VQRALAGSHRVVGLYHDGAQVGFARAVSDGATVAYLADVYVLEAHRGRGLGLALVGEILEGESLRDVRWLLHTADAQRLYSKLGFVTGPPPYPLMERPRGWTGPAAAAARGERADAVGPGSRSGRGGADSLPRP